MSKQKHLSRLAAPKSWPIVRKSTKWIAKSVPGPHSLQNGMPLVVWLCEVLKVARNKSEAKKILNQVLINGSQRKEIRFPVGLFDTIGIPKIDKYYRVVLNENGKLKLIEISSSENGLVLTKVIKKTTLAKGKTQVTLSNGWNFLADPKEYSVGDSVLFNVSKKSVEKLPFVENSLCYVYRGKHVSSIGRVKEFVREGFKKYVLLDCEGETIKVPKDACFVVGKEKPVIKLK